MNKGSTHKFCFHIFKSFLNRMWRVFIFVWKATKNIVAYIRKKLPDANQTIAIFTVILGAASVYGLHETKKEFEILNRASVFVKTPVLASAVEDQSLKWLLSTTWQNTGAVPTKDMTTIISSYLGSSDLPSGFSRCSYPMRARVPIGAHTELPFEILRFTPEQIKLFQNSEVKHFYVWGITNYQDGFSETPHTSRFCWRISSITGNPNSSAPLRIAYFLCGEGNCIDGECLEEDSANYSIPSTKSECYNLNPQFVPITRYAFHQ